MDKKKFRSIIILVDNLKRMMFFAVFSACDIGVEKVIYLSSSAEGVDACVFFKLEIG